MFVKSKSGYSSAVAMVTAVGAAVVAVAAVTEAGEEALPVSVREVVTAPGGTWWAMMVPFSGWKRQ